MKGVVYRLVNKQTEQSYIGQTTNLKRRLSPHKSDAKSKKEDNRPILKAIREYGMESFDVEILFESEDFKDKNELRNLLEEKEIYYIAKFNTTKSGYNLAKGGKGSLGLHASDKQKEAVRKANTGRIVSEKERKLTSNRFKKWWTEERRKILSERMSGSGNPNYGKEFPGRRRPTLLGKPIPEERRRKISEALKGKKGHPMSEENKIKLSKLYKGVPKSEEHRKNAAEAKKGKQVPSKWIPILQYTPEGVFIKEWPSIREAKNLYKSNQIGCCAKGKFRTIAGFIWRYKTSDDIPQRINVPMKRNSKGLFLPE